MNDAFMATLPANVRFSLLRGRSALSIDNLAKAMGYAGASSIQRYQSPDYKEQFLPMRLHEALSKALVGKGAPPITQADVDDLFYWPPRSVAPDTQLVPVLQTGRLPIRFRVGAGTWYEVDNFADEPYGWADIPPRPEIPMDDQWLEQVVGDSFNMRYPEGTLLLVRAGWATDWFKMHGRRVIVQRTRDDGRYIERTVKEIVVTTAGQIELWPRSFNPKWSAPIKYRQNMKETDTVEIVGLVLSATIPEGSP